MSFRRVALIFDDDARPVTTGTYVRRALAGLVEQVMHVRPADLDGLDTRGFDLFLAVDDDLTYPIPDRLPPLAWWAIDSHLDLGRCLARARGAVHASRPVRPIPPPREPPP